MADFRKVAVAVAVAILFAFFVGLLLDLVYEAPKYETFCKPDDFFRAKPLIAPASAVPEEQCIYGEEYQQCLKKGGTPELNYTNATCPSFESCNLCKLLVRIIFGRDNQCGHLDPYPQLFHAPDRVKHRVS